MKIFGFKIFEEVADFEEVVTYGIVIGLDYNDAISKIRPGDGVNRIELDYLKEGSLFSCNAELYGEIVDTILY